MEQQYYKISEFARLIGVSSATLRSWDERGLLHPHHVSPSGYRYYSYRQLQDYLNGCYKDKAGEKGGDSDERL